MANDANIFQGSRFAQHGDRQQLQALARQGGVRTQAAPPPLQGAQPPTAPRARRQVGGQDIGDPLSFLLGRPPAGDPLTSGLAVGPGAGPPQALTPGPDLSRQQKLAAVATMAKSPSLRAAALAALRAMTTSSSTTRGR